MSMRRSVGDKGITTALVVSPFVDASGQPSILLRLNAPAARAFLRALSTPTHPAPRDIKGHHLF
jgi:hypothetical protein